MFDRARQVIDEELERLANENAIFPRGSDWCDDRDSLGSVDRGEDCQ
jgi:hypothetical protein